MKPVVRTVVVVALLLSLVLGASATDGLAHVAAAGAVVTETSSTVDVTATTTFSFTPDIINGVPNGVSISFDFTNGDTNGLVHTFTILGCPNVTVPRSGPNAYDLSLFINSTKTHPGCTAAPLVNIVPAAQSSKTVVRTTPPKAGWYEFVCTESGHFQQGMYGFIAFGTIVPANLTPTAPNTGAGTAVFIIVGTIVTLTVIAIVLGFVVGRREGAKFEMPPERLGYPEPGHPPVVRPPPPPPPPSP